MIKLPAFILLLFIPFISLTRVAAAQQLFPYPLSGDGPHFANYNAIIETIDSEKIDFGKFKNKIIFAHIWSTTCVPCIPELPHLQQLYNSLPKDSLVFLMIAEDKSKKRVETFLKKRNLTFPVYFISAGWPFWDVKNGQQMAILMPSTYIINRDARIIFNKIGVLDYAKGKIRKKMMALIREK